VREGQSGAVLDETIGLVSKALGDIVATETKVEVTHKNNGAKKGAPITILVLCAGENDIGQGYSVDKIIRSFERVVDECFAFDLHLPTTTKVIYLGPKIEPWLADDPSSRKRYVKVSKALQRAAERHERKADIRYVDCLLMFCGDSANVPGAVTAKAKAEEVYFVNDALHLSDEGYAIWKRVVETEVSKMLLSIDEACNP